MVELCSKLVILLLGHDKDSVPDFDQLVHDYMAAVGTVDYDLP